MKRTRAGLRACCMRGCTNPTATRNSLKCVAHRERSTACEHHDVAGECTEECATLVNQMRGDVGGESMVYGDYLGGESSVDRSGCSDPEPRTETVARLDPARRAVVMVEVQP